MDAIIEAFSVLWTTELFAIDGQPLTIGKALTGLFLLGFGYWLSRRGADAVDRRFFSRMQMDTALRHTLRRVTFYVFLLISTLFTLRLLNVPITIFTVLGGAVAIGIGFGSQNVINNFISGMIMMIEQPIRVGDHIEVEGHTGTVEIIGTRSTVIRTPENKEVILPNSFFLEKAVLNWTLNDNIVRTSLVVGVAYGSPVRQVEKILLQVAREHSEVIKTHPPRVIFTDFAYSALVFTLYFWVHVGNRYVAEVASDLRYKIDESFRANNISIPFPQREVHVFQKSL